ncbi:hypothetical protein SARC_01990 [Sphaeroforma arctica JP610]|uniref:YrhK domain-containing protein n=1 Tax=Sphaeroforma arctica JP610 TaxID=667725 RepID=A0A0L0GAA9_9EUKA|nr:hypothetical protein SARC_01990 [Sphaeroforma arctica JP610]KNC85844.1 hypothetical protein SARC_01990 [Sphaeroforma arctica JP610]|eukprot:XP_014159746.1 hypothetical protein SARC_01990 [Sphaeroforma arctica JP610]
MGVICSDRDSSVKDNCTCGYAGDTQKQSVEGLESALINLKLWWAAFFMCLLGALAFIAGSILFLPELYDHISIGVYLFVFGVSTFWVCWAWSAYNLRHRHTDYTSAAYKWDRLAETLWFFCYLSGYMPGSILFLPGFDPVCVTIGAYMFVWGSVLLLFAQTIQMIVFSWLNEQGNEPWINKQADMFSGISYLIGGSLWLVASVLYLIGVTDNVIYQLAAGIYTVGSGFFTSGAVFALWALNRRLQTTQKMLETARSGQISSA